MARAPSISRRTVRRLHATGARVTPQRLAVAEALDASAEQVTAEELWAQVRRRDPELGRATVFRALEALVAAGVARRLEMDGHVSGYIACRPGHHHHLVCRDCGTVEEIGQAFIDPMTRRIAAERGFVTDDARLDLYGRCADCADQ